MNPFVMWLWPMAWPMALLDAQEHAERQMFALGDAVDDALAPMIVAGMHAWADALAGARV